MKIFKRRKENKETLKELLEIKREYEAVKIELNKLTKTCINTFSHKVTEYGLEFGSAASGVFWVFEQYIKNRDIAAEMHLRKMQGIPESIMIIREHETFDDATTEDLKKLIKVLNQKLKQEDE